MKKIPILILILALVFSLAACSGRSPEEENLYTKLKPVTLICADSTSQGSAGQLFGQYFAQRVSEITDSKLTIDYRPNGELGGDLALLRKMQADELQMVVCQTAPMVSFVQEMAVFDLPMVFSGYDGDRIDAVLNGENPFSAKLAEASENAGIQLLGFLQDGTYRLTTSNRSLTTLEDFQGLHIRTMENENHMAFWTALGADPVPLPWEEVYSALLKGSIDAQENAADTCYGASLQNVQKYLACTDHILYCNLLSMNKTAWDALDPAYQAASGRRPPRLSPICAPSWRKWTPTISRSSWKAAWSASNMTPPSPKASSLWRAFEPCMKTSTKTRPAGWGRFCRRS